MEAEVARDAERNVVVAGPGLCRDQGAADGHPSDVLGLDAEVVEAARRTENLATDTDADDLGDQRFVVLHPSCRSTDRIVGVSDEPVQTREYSGYETGLDPVAADGHRPDPSVGVDYAASGNA